MAISDGEGGVRGYVTNGKVTSLGWYHRPCLTMPRFFRRGRVDLSRSAGALHVWPFSCYATRECQVSICWDISSMACGEDECLVD